jgi:hypothetical protein
MRRTTVLFSFLLLTISFGLRAFAQDAPKPADSPKVAEAPVHFYHLDFSIQELGADGKPTNTRAFSATVTTDPRFRTASIRTGSRIPIVTGAASASAAGQGKEGVQFQYLDVGVSIDVRGTREVGRDLALDLSAEVSSLANSPNPLGPADPVIRQNHWQAAVLIPIGKATVAFASDALESKGAMQLVVTATPLP